ncbi:MAG: hypothetical protein N2Z68_02975 [Patescibacteria group bacterium]|nr:hypothetical protein [Patescibacteria group bacterium]
MKQWLSKNWFKIAILIIAFLYVVVLAFEQYRLWRNSEWRVAKKIYDHLLTLPKREDKAKFYDDFWKAEKELGPIQEKIWIMLKTDFRPF